MRSGSTESTTDHGRPTTGGASGRRSSVGSRRLRIGLALRNNRAWIGGTHYVFTWVRALASLPPEERPEIVLLYSSREGEADARELGAWADGVGHLADARTLGLDFVYPVKELNEAPVGVPWGGWIVDWQQRYLPELFNPEEHRHRELRYRFMARYSPILVLSSQMALDDTDRWVERPHAPLARLHFPALLEADVLDGDPDAVRAKYGLPPRYLLVCNQWYRHKNHITVVEALARLHREGLRIPCAFTGLTGDHRWPNYFPAIQAIVERNAMAGETFILGQVPREDQLQLLRGAAAVIQPSLFEGWSTIVEEGRALGKLMVLSDIPVHREQSPPGARFFESQSVEDLAREIVAVWRDEIGPEVARERERQALEAHRQNVQDAGRELLRVAEVGRANYNPSFHDPVVGMVALMRAVQVDEPALALARHYAIAATRSLVLTQPRQLPRLVRQVILDGPHTAAFALRRLSVALAVWRLGRVKRRAAKRWRALRSALLAGGLRRKLYKRARRLAGQVPGAVPAVRAARRLVGQGGAPAGRRNGQVPASGSAAEQVAARSEERGA